MTVLPPPPGFDVTRPVRDIGSAHPLLQSRYFTWSSLMRKLGFPVFVNEVYRYDLRQKWLYAQGRTKAQCLAVGVPPEFARPGPVVTNATSAETSAHGWTERAASGILVTASAAMDVVPVGKDGKPWTADDPWDDWINAANSLEASTGLVHFHKLNAPIWDKPHLQLREWSDDLHRVVL